MSDKLLNGYRVIEYAQTLSGMHCGAMLAEMGVEVIKVEIPGDPDDLTRSEAPIVNGASAAFASVNVGKKSVSLDFRTPEGAEVMKKLLATADAFIITKRMSDMKEMGFDYDTVHAINPKLVYASVTCFGQSGPLSGLKGGELIAQAASGTMMITGDPKNPPTRSGSPFAEMHSAANLASGILATWYKIRKGGEGQLVDVSLADELISEMRINTGMYIYNGKVSTRGELLVGDGAVKAGPEYPQSRTQLKTTDGYVVLSANSQKLFQKAADATGMGDMLEDPEFKKEVEASTLCQAIDARFQGWAISRTTKEVFDTISQGGAPCAPIYTYKQMLQDENLNEYRHMFTKVQDPVIGELTVAELPVQWNRCKPSIDSPAPAEGQHTEEVLAAL